MRIALLHPLPDASRWSMNIYHEELARSLGRLLGRGDSLISFPENGAFGTCGKLARYWQQYVQYGFSARGIAADVYHITDHGYGNLIPFLKRKKIVTSFHDALLPNLDKGNLPVKTKPHTAIAAQRNVLRWLGESAHVLTISEFSKQELLRFSNVPEDRATAIHLGIRSDFFRAASQEEKKSFRKKWKLPEDAPAVLISGRTDPHKNIEGSLRAFTHFVREYSSNAVLVKTGSPFSAGQQKLIDESGLSSRIFYLGQLSYEEIPLVYQSCSALLFLSFYEGFGFPVLEAMASGIPAVISNCGSLPEVAGDAAVIVEAQSMEQAAEALHKVLTQETFRQGLIEKGKKHAAGFTWEETARKTMDIYKRVLK